MVSAAKSHKKAVVNCHTAKTRFIEESLSVLFVITLHKIFKTSFSSACHFFLF